MPLPQRFGVDALLLDNLAVLDYPLGRLIVVELWLAHADLGVGLALLLGLRVLDGHVFQQAGLVGILQNGLGPICLPKSWTLVTLGVQSWRAVIEAGLSLLLADVLGVGVVCILSRVEGT